MCFLGCWLLPFSDLKIGDKTTSLGFTYFICLFLSPSKASKPFALELPLSIVQFKRVVELIAESLSPIHFE